MPSDEVNRQEEIQKQESCCWQEGEVCWPSVCSQFSVIYEQCLSQFRSVSKPPCAVISYIAKQLVSSKSLSSDVFPLVICIKVSFTCYMAAGSYINIWICSIFIIFSPLYHKKVLIIIKTLSTTQAYSIWGGKTTYQ